MNLNDIMLINDNDNFLNESLPFFPSNLFPSTDDVLALSKQLEQLNLDVNTQNLKIEVEKLKREKIGNSVRQIKIESASLH